MPETRLVRGSSLYRNPPAGYLDQPEFVNAVARIETRLAPRDLLEQLLAIERAHGRVRDFPNGPRTLDLDILLYGERTVREIVAATHMSSFDACRVLGQFLQARIVRRKTA